MMNQWIQSENNLVEREQRLEPQALFFSPDWGRGKKLKRKKVVGKKGGGGAGGERRERKEGKEETKDS